MSRVGASSTPEEATLERESSTSKSDRVLQGLARAIILGELSPGALLPTEKDLSQRYAVSRPVVREAISRLGGAGLVATRHGLGSVVNPPKLWNVFDPLVLRAHLDLGNLPAILQELIELRRSVEVEAAGIAAERMTQVERTLLKDWLDRMRACLNDAETSARADFAFHNVILAATQNRFFDNIMKHVGETLWESRRLTSRVGGVKGRSRALDAHTAIYQAIVAKDAEAARGAMRQHITQSEEDLKQAALALIGSPSSGSNT